MAARKKTKTLPKAPAVREQTNKSPKRQTAEPRDDSPYLGCFFFDDYLNDKEHTGTFQMVVAASSPEHALDRFKKRLRAIRRIGSVLSGPNTVYLQGLVPLRGPFGDGILINYESRPSPDPPDYQLLNMTPEQGVEELGSCQLADDDEDGIQPFVDFGGKARERTQEAAKPAGDDLSPSGLRQKPRLSSEEREKVRAEQAVLRAKRAADAEAKKRARQAAAEAKQRRERALKATLGELHGATGKLSHKKS
ncbi:MAG: hypothetical protein WDO69_33870 [Pseudomonadota bacterium]